MCTVPKPSARETPLERLSQVLLLLVPSSTVLFVGLCLFAVSEPRPFTYARLLGGPTEGHGPWTGRVQVLERRGALERALPGVAVRVEWSDAGEGASWSGQSDAEGWAEVRLERRPGDRNAELRVEVGEPWRLAASGKPQVSVKEWLGLARQHVGKVRGRTQGVLQIELTVARGVLAVPFAGDLDISVSAGDQPAGAVELIWTTTGLDVVTRAPLVTDSGGRARLRVAPREHVVSLALEARSDNGVGTWFSTLPVVAGAAMAEVTGAVLKLQSPVERDVLWYSWVNRLGRLGGGRLPLTPEEWGASGMVPVPTDLRAAWKPEETWVVVSSEPDGRSPSAVGWPVGQQSVTFDVGEALVLEGSAMGELRDARFRRRVRWGVSAYSLLAMVLTVALFVRRARQDQARFRGRLAAQSQDAAFDAVANPPDGAVRLLVAAACVMLGFATITLVGLLWGS